MKYRADDGAVAVNEIDRGQGAFSCQLHLFQNNDPRSCYHGKVFVTADNAAGYFAAAISDRPRA